MHAEFCTLNSSFIMESVMLIQSRGLPRSGALLHTVTLTKCLLPQLVFVITACILLVFVSDTDIVYLRLM